jgi:hypothetical protein
VPGAGPTTGAVPGTTPRPAAENTTGAGVSPDGAATALTSQTPEPTKKAVPRPSEKALDYAEELGGVSHLGQQLYFLIGDSVETEREAQSLLDEAIPRFGDMQSYFIVQRSDNFEGMRPGWWVVFEAYRMQPSDANLQFGKRGFPGAYVKRATVLTNDPLPVYDVLASP